MYEKGNRLMQRRSRQINMGLLPVLKSGGRPDDNLAAREKTEVRGRLVEGQGGADKGGVNAGEEVGKGIPIGFSLGETRRCVLPAAVGEG